MSLYAANNICKAIARLSTRHAGRLAGVICNAKNMPREGSCGGVCRTDHPCMIQFIPVTA